MALLASCSGDRDPGQEGVENGPWSTVVNGLQARLSIERDDAFNGTPIISVWIELRNASHDDAAPLVIAWGEGGFLKFSLTDQDNRDFVVGALAYDGFDAPIRTLAIPMRSSLRYYASKSGAGVGRNAKALIDCGPMATYEIKSGDANAYALHCTISVAESPRDGERSSWHGVLKVPSIAVVH